MKKKKRKLVKAKKIKAKTPKKPSSKANPEKKIESDDLWNGWGDVVGPVG